MFETWTNKMEANIIPHVHVQQKRASRTVSYTLNVQIGVKASGTAFQISSVFLNPHDTSSETDCRWHQRLDKHTLNQKGAEQGLQTPSLKSDYCPNEPKHSAVPGETLRTQAGVLCANAFGKLLHPSRRTAVQK